MKASIAILFASTFAIASCDQTASNASAGNTSIPGIKEVNFPSGIAGASRSGDEVMVIYSAKKTSQQDILDAATIVCGENGQSAGAIRVGEMHHPKPELGMDAKSYVQCI